MKLNFLLVFLAFASFVNAQYSALDYCSSSKINNFNKSVKHTLTGNQDDFDLIYCKMEMDINTSNYTMNSSNMLEIRFLASNINSVDLDLTDLLVVNSILLDGNPLSFQHSSDVLHIELNKNYQFGEIITLRINYGGTPGSNFHFDTKNENPMIWTLSEPYGAKDWWPCKNLPDDKLDSVDMIITVPSDLKVASNGILIDIDTLTSGKLTYHWKERYTIATYLVSLAIHPYIVDLEFFKYSEDDSLRIENYIVPANYDANKDKYDVIVEMLETFSDLYGLYPFIDEKYGHAEIPFDGGMEHQTITSCLGPYEGLLVHELGHQWWGDMITCKDFHHIWLNEGFATYTEALWEEHKNGIDGLKTSMDGKKYLGYGSVYCDNVEESGRIFSGNLSYNKGAWVLHMLRHVVGDDVFFKILKSWGESAWKYDVAVTKDFQDVCESVTQYDLDYFFDQWIYGDFHPIYLYDWNYTEGIQNYNVELSLLQFQVDRIYKMPVDITIETENGEYEFTIFNDKKYDKYTFSVDSKPTDVIIDKNGWILKETRNEINLLNHDNNNLYLTIGTTGSIGYDTPDGLGNGMIIKDLDENVVYYGSLIFGNSADYIVDNPEKVVMMILKNYL
ncbi:MAG: M1 family metallopeptidase [Saprospiraceae bacterium]